MSICISTFSLQNGLNWTLQKWIHPRLVKRTRSKWKRRHNIDLLGVFSTFHLLVVQTKACKVVFLHVFPALNPMVVFFWPKSAPKKSAAPRELRPWHYSCKTKLCMITWKEQKLKNYPKTFQNWWNDCWSCGLAWSEASTRILSLPSSSCLFRASIFALVLLSFSIAILFLIA